MHLFRFSMHLTEKIADALLAIEVRKSVSQDSSTIQTQAQIHSPRPASSLETTPQSSTAQDVTSPPGSSVLSGGSREEPAVGGLEGVPRASLEKVEHQLAITTQELMETKEALEESERRRFDQSEVAGDYFSQIFVVPF